MSSGAPDAIGASLVDGLKRKASSNSATPLANSGARGASARHKIAGKDFSTIASTRAYMSHVLKALLPTAEIHQKAELVYEISRLKKDKGAMLLGHNYMEAALFHTVTDICGDSLQLARLGASCAADVLVMCGVRFMAETAKILSPEKTILLPSDRAGCSLASSITAQEVRELKKLYPGVPVVSYVNTYADVKAESDICCTSSNAQAVIEHLGSNTVIFIPDQYLAANMARQTGKSLIVVDRTPDGVLPRTIHGGCDARGREQSILVNSVEESSDGELGALVSWPGVCEVHEKFTVEDIENIREQFGSSVVVLAHPECPPDVCAAADFSGSTSAMIRYVSEVPAQRYLLLTECAMADNIIAENPGKDLLRMCSHRCPHMATITLEMTLKSLETFTEEIEIDESVRLRAYRALNRMTQIS